MPNKLLAITIILLLVITSLSVVSSVSATSTDLSSTELWSFTAPSHTNYNTTFYWSVKTMENRVYAVESESYKIPGENHPLLPYGRTINTLYALTSDGAKLWDFTTVYIDGLTVADKTVFISVKSSDFDNINKIFTLDADDGSQKWMLSVPGTIEWQNYANGIVYVGVAHIVTGEGYFIYAVNATTGQQIWRQTFRWGDDYPESVIVDNGVIYFAHSRIPSPEGYEGQDEYYAINATDGSTVWKVVLNGSVNGPSALSSGLICLSTVDAVWGLNATNGQIVWSIPREQGYNFTSNFGYRGGTVYAVGYQDYDWPIYEPYPGYLKVYALNASNGSILWNYITKGHSLNSLNPRDYYALNIEGETIYLMMDYRTLYAISAIDGRELWTHSGRLFALDSSVVYFYAYGNNVEAVDAPHGMSLWNCTTTARFVGSQNNVEYFSMASKIYALSITGNSLFEPNPIVPPTQSPNPATPNPTIVAPNPTVANNQTPKPTAAYQPSQTPDASPTPSVPEFPIAGILLVLAVASVSLVYFKRRRGKS